MKKRFGKGVLPPASDKGQAIAEAARRRIKNSSSNVTRMVPDGETGSAPYSGPGSKRLGETASNGFKRFKNPYTGGTTNTAPPGIGMKAPGSMKGGGAPSGPTPPGKKRF